MLLNRKGLLRAGVGKHGSAQAPAASAALTPPAVESILHWFDLTDTSVMYTDTAGTTNISADEDEFARINNQGIAEDYLFEDTAGQRGVWSAADNGVIFNNDNINNAEVALVATLPGSVAVLGYEVVAYNNQANIVFGWHTYTVCGLRSDNTDVASNTWSAFAYSNTAINFGVKPSAGVPASMIFYGNADPAQKAWSSLEATPMTGTASSTFPGAGQEMIIGAFSNAGGNGPHAIVREVIIWNNYQLTDQDVADLKVYDNAKHGTVWAT